jgi:hypothetical protein
MATSAQQMDAQAALQMGTHVIGRSAARSFPLRVSHQVHIA